MLRLQYLLLYIRLLQCQTRVLLNLLLENCSFPLEARLQEALSHVLDYVVVAPAVDRCELDPLAQEAGAHLDSIAQVQFVVLSSAEHSQEELGHAVLVAAPVLEEQSHSVCREQVDNNNESRKEPRRPF